MSTWVIGAIEVTTAFPSFDTRSRSGAIRCPSPTSTVRIASSAIWPQAISMTRAAATSVSCGVGGVEGACLFLLEGERVDRDDPLRAGKPHQIAALELARRKAGRTAGGS